MIWSSDFSMPLNTADVQPSEHSWELPIEKRTFQTHHKSVKPVSECRVPPHDCSQMSRPHEKIIPTTSGSCVSMENTPHYIFCMLMLSSGLHNLIQLQSRQADVPWPWPPLPRWLHPNLHSSACNHSAQRPLCTN